MFQTGLEQDTKPTARINLMIINNITIHNTIRDYKGEERGKKHGKTDKTAKTIKNESIIIHAWSDATISSEDINESNELISYELSRPVV